MRSTCFPTNAVIDSTLFELAFSARSSCGRETSTVRCTSRFPAMLSFCRRVKAENSSGSASIRLPSRSRVLISPATSIRADGSFCVGRRVRQAAG